MTNETKEAGRHAMVNLAIVSMHEKGFPEGDLYFGCAGISASDFEACGAAPDDFFTLKKGDTLEQAEAFARQHWPSAEIRVVVPEQRTKTEG